MSDWASCMTTKRTLPVLLVAAILSFVLLNATARLAVMQAETTATPERTQRPRPQASPTIGQALVTIEQDTQLFTQPDNTSEIIFALPTTPNNFGRLLAVTRDQRWYQIEIGN